jgi:hypothetical protein
MTDADPERVDAADGMGNHGSHGSMVDGSSDRTIKLSIGAEKSSFVSGHDFKVEP